MSSETRICVGAVVVAVTVGTEATVSASELPPPPRSIGMATSAPTSRSATGQRRFSTRSESRLRRKLT